MLNMLFALPFKEIILKVALGERNIDSVDRLLAHTYIEKGYDQIPRTKAEAGGKEFNSQMSSFTLIELCPHEIIGVEIMATPYMFRNATIDIAKKYGAYVAREASVCMAHVSCIALDIYEGEPVIIAQLKGDAVGKGEIHAGLVAGGISAEHLKTNDPFFEALKTRLHEEIGFDIDLLPSPPEFCVMIDERENGFVNIASVNKIKLEDVKNAYLNSIKGKPLDKLQVSGLAIIPIRNADSIIDSIKIFKPDENGNGEFKPEKRGIRPYTKAIIEGLADVKFQDLLIEKAGL